MEDYLDLIEQTRYYYFYLICLRTHIDSKIKVFKLGRSWSIKSRFNGYPKNSILLYLCRVKDGYHVEHEMIKVFKHNFILEKDLGNEFFKGNINDMIKCATNVIEYMNQKIDDDFSPIRTKYKNRLKFHLNDEDEINDEDYEFIFESKPPIKPKPHSESKSKINTDNNNNENKKCVDPHKSTHRIVMNIIECCKIENTNKKYIDLKNAYEKLIDPFACRYIDSMEENTYTKDEYDKLVKNINFTHADLKSLKSNGKLTDKYQIIKIIFARMGIVFRNHSKRVRKKNKQIRVQHYVLYRDEDIYKKVYGVITDNKIENAYDKEFWDMVLSFT